MRATSTEKEIALIPLKKTSILHEDLGKAQQLNHVLIAMQGRNIQLLSKVGDDANDVWQKSVVLFFLLFLLF